MGKAKKRGRSAKRQEEGMEVGKMENEVEGMYRRYAARQYEDWMWGTAERNEYGFPEVTMLFALVNLKRKLWKRYGFFYDAETIREVYPDNEIAEWVRAAFERREEPKVEWRDKEMSYEWCNDWCEKRTPTKIRTYDAELQVQARRRKYREATVNVGESQGARIPTRRKNAEDMAKLALSQEEERLIRQERDAFWQWRRNPVKAQHDAGEPDHLWWDALQGQDRSSQRMKRVATVKIVVKKGRLEGVEE